MPCVPQSVSGWEIQKDRLCIIPLWGLEMFQQELFLQQHIDLTIERMREFCPQEGYYLGFSGGKDSGCLKRLADLAGVKYEAHFHRTTVDPPEVIRFIREFHPDVIFDRPSISMFDLIIEQGCPPTRRMRYCCRVFKESYGAGRIVLTGVRRAEGHTRHGHKLVHQCPSQAKTLLNPMIDWHEEAVWGFIRDEGIPYCSLYDEGWKRIGCIGCPNAGKNRVRQFQRWPKFERAYMRCFDKMLKERVRKGLKTRSGVKVWKTSEDVMDWWLEKEKWLKDSA